MKPTSTVEDSPNQTDIKQTEYHSNLIDILTNAYNNLIAPCIDMHDNHLCFHAPTLDNTEARMAAEGLSESDDLCSQCTINPDISDSPPCSTVISLTTGTADLRFLKCKVFAYIFVLSVSLCFILIPRGLLYMMSYGSTNLIT